MTTYNSNTAARKMLTIALLVIMFFSFMSMACEDGGTVQETGEQVVTDVLLSTSELERAVYEQVCQPGNLSNPDCQ